MAYPLAPQMPFPFYKILTPRDLDAVVSFVRSVQPVRNEVQPPVYKAPMHVEPVPGAEKPFGEGWDDKQYILQRGLDKVRDAAGLEVKFHRFIERSLDFLNKQCFLLAFDDVDTSFARGWPVLEVIRRYLTSPRWVSVVCGDLDLFAILVRGQQWANFTIKSLRYDDPTIPSFRSMVDHLQGQYLLKVLRPDNRITLQPVAALTDQINVGWEPRNSNQRTLADFVEARKAVPDLRPRIEHLQVLDPEDRGLLVDSRAVASKVTIDGGDTVRFQKVYRLRR